MPSPGRFISILATLLCASCADQPVEPFYEPPADRVSVQDGLESLAATCERRERLLQRLETGGPSDLAEALQQQFLEFGFDEIRVDPLTTGESEGGHHVTASVRGATRDTLLVVVDAPPLDGGNLVPFSAVARAWSQRSNPDLPPLMTVRFSVLAATDQRSVDEVVADFLEHRPRTVTQTLAAIVLEAGNGSDLRTNDETFHPFLATLAPTASATPPRLAEPSHAKLSAALAGGGLPVISGDFAAEVLGTSCSASNTAAATVASQRLVDLIETAIRALGTPPTEGGIALSEG